MGHTVRGWRGEFGNVHTMGDKKPSYVGTASDSMTLGFVCLACRVDKWVRGHHRYTSVHIRVL